MRKILRNIMTKNPNQKLQKNLILQKVFELGFQNSINLDNGPINWKSLDIMTRNLLQVE